MTDNSSNNDQKLDALYYVYEYEKKHDDSSIDFLRSDIEKFYNYLHKELMQTKRRHYSSNYLIRNDFTSKDELGDKYITKLVLIKIQLKEILAELEKEAEEMGIIFDSCLNENDID